MKSEHVRELVTGLNYSGACVVGDREIYAEIFCFDGKSSLESPNVWFFEKKDAQILSLHDCIEQSACCGVRSFEEGDHIFHHKISANIAVIGPTKWGESDKISSVRFRIPGAKEALWRLDELEALQKVPNQNFDNHAISCKMDCCNVDVYYTFAVDMMIGVNSYDFYFHLSFKEGKSIYEYFDYVLNIVSFFSFLSGKKFRPSDIYIRNHTVKQNIKPKMEEYLETEHKVVYLWGEGSREENFSGYGLPILIRRVNDEKIVFPECMKQWMQRSPRWNDAYAAMMGYLQKRDYLSADRLLALCVWLEEIPETRPSSAVDKNTINEVAKSAAQKCKELGAPKFAERVINAIKDRNTESRSDYIDRIRILLANRFGSEVFDEDIRQHILAGGSFRGRAAHGSFDSVLEIESRSFQHALYALEAFCAGRTLLDLKLTDSAIERLERQSWFSPYRRRI